MTTPAAVGINNNFSAGQASITVRATYNKPTSWVDVVCDVTGVQVIWKFWFYNLFNDVRLNLFVRNMRGMLRGDNDSINSYWFITVVFNGYLTL